MINIILADHEAIFRTGAARVLAVEDDLRIVGQPQSYTQILNGLKRLRAHILLVSRRLLLDLLEQKVLPGRLPAAVVVIAEHDDAAASFMTMGVRGVVYRSIDGPSLVHAVRRVARGRTFIHSPNSDITEIHEDRVGVRTADRLSELELCVIGAVFNSCTNRGIAEQLGTTEQAVKSLIRSIFDKTGVSDRLELALFVYHHRMLGHAVEAVSIEKGFPFVFRDRNTAARVTPASLSLADEAMLSDVREQQRALSVV